MSSWDVMFHAPAEELGLGTHQGSTVLVFDSMIDFHRLEFQFGGI